MAIRWVSTPESIKANQYSVLAIVETLTAMAVSIWIAVTWNTFLHIAIGASIAPLLLMRTDRSCILCARISQKLVRPIIGIVEIPIKYRGWRKQLLYMTVALPPIFIWLPLQFLIGRLVAGVTIFFRYPLLTLGSITKNWLHATIVVDSKKWPDVLPKPSEVPELFDAPGIFFDVGEMMEGLRNFSDRTKSKKHLLLFLFMMSLTIISAFVYRWSLKSTAIIWFPLLWATNPVRNVNKPLKSIFDIYSRNPITKIVLIVSTTCIIGFITKIVLFNLWTGFLDWWSSSTLLEFFSLYAVPSEIQIWQVTIFLNSVIAICMYIFVRQNLIRIEHNDLANVMLPRQIFRVGMFVRRLLTCYTIICTLYITIRAASDWQLPALGTKLFPWM